MKLPNKLQYRDFVRHAVTPITSGSQYPVLLPSQHGRQAMKSILGSALMGAAALWLVLLWGASHAREQYPGQYKDVPKDVQEWFRSQHRAG
jgi:hypothetical protein